jgi:beta-glucanase (GH16 family)
MDIQELKTISIIMAFIVLAGGITILAVHKKHLAVVTTSSTVTKTIDQIHAPVDTASASSLTTILSNMSQSTPEKTSLTQSETLISGMKMTFDEEFNTLSLYRDSEGNVTCNPGGKGIWQTVYDFCSRTIPTNDEAEIYIDQNFLDYMNSTVKVPSPTKTPFSINNGVLTISANPSDSIIQSAAGPWAKYTSGLLTTQFSFSQTYGYFEMRAKLPAGKGLWPAFWLLPVDKSWPPEIDALEAFGGTNAKGEGATDTIHYASHTIVTNDSCGAWSNVGVDVTEGFHIYGVDWEPTGITYYFDGKPYAKCPANPEADKPFYILINLAVGGTGSWPGTPTSSNVWPAQMQVDYVRAYQKK